MTIGSSQGNSQGDAVSIGKQMVLASQFAPIRGIWAGFFTSTGGTQGRAIDECAIPIDLVLSLEFRKQRLKDTLPKPRLSATGEGGASRCSQKENPSWPEAISTGCPFARRRECREPPAVALPAFVQRTEHSGFPWASGSRAQGDPTSHQAKSAEP